MHAIQGWARTFDPAVDGTARVLLQQVKDFADKSQFGGRFKEVATLNAQPFNHLMEARWKIEQAKGARPQRDINECDSIASDLH